MTAPSMPTITESLERSLKNCSLNHETSRSSSSISEGSAKEGIIGRSSTIADDNSLLNTVPETSLDLQSHLFLPCHWEQCLDLKTGEIYYINRRNGMKAREDPRTASEYSGHFYSEEEDEEGDDDNCSYDSEVSSSESSPSASRDGGHHNNNNHHHRVRVEKDKDNVLVVAGCTSCLMYFMVLKQVEDCPKCNYGQLLHFDRSKSCSP